MTINNVMLACTIDFTDLVKRSPALLSKLKFPYLLSAKYDGIRCITTREGPRTRALKCIPNLHIQKILSRELPGLDGELIVGDPHDPMVYNKTESAVMTVSGGPQFKLYVFDSIAMGLRAATERLAVVMGMSDTPTIEIVQQYPVESIDDILFYEAWYHAQGFEGVCLRQFASRYKHGRSTVKEGALLRVIREATDEATVVGFKEKMTNNNPQTVNERGYATRSSHKANLQGANMLGALTVKSKKFRHEFDIGTGFTDDERKWIWFNKDKVLHRTIVFKYKPYGVKDRPRQPRFKGFRSLLDM